MIVNVYSVTVAEGSSVGYATGLSEDGVRVIRFVGDPRALAAIGEALHRGKQSVPCTVEDWQVLSESGGK